MAADDAPGSPPAGFWGRATIALVLALYGWSMIGVEMYLISARPRPGPERVLLAFRRQIMGRGVVGLGAAAVLAAIVLALLARRQRGVAWIALALSAAWIGVVLWLWPRL